jgi:hypothetical protein
LKEIVVLREGSLLENNNWNLGFVEPAVQWFKERTRQRACNAMEEL